MKRRVFISVASNKNLDDRRKRVKAAVIDKIREAGYEPQEFWESGLPENLAWNFESVDRVMRKCVGAAVVGFPRFADGIVGEYNHYEGAVANTLGLPLFLIAEQGVMDRGIVWTGGGKTITYMPSDADETWVKSSDFLKRFNAWQRELSARKDVFLAYCSKSEGTAAQIQIHLVKQGASVHNWAMDFRSGGTILSEIDNARAACTCGVFLFSEDDPMEGTPGVAAPRDNVVFEAGYFMSVKGPEKCLIVRHGEAKMPADLGSTIYVHLPKSASVSSIDGRLRDFLTQNL